MTRMHALRWPPKDRHREFSYRFIQELAVAASSFFIRSSVFSHNIIIRSTKRRMYTWMDGRDRSRTRNNTYYTIRSRAIEGLISCSARKRPAAGIPSPSGVV